MANMAVRRLALGYFIRPAASETGSSQPRVEPVLAYLVRHGNGLILFDTGIGDADPETEAHYRPRRRALEEALSAAGAKPRRHLRGGELPSALRPLRRQPLLGGRPIFVQEAELAAARGGDHTFDELVDFPGATYEVTSKRDRDLAGSPDHPDARSHARPSVAGPPSERRHGGPRRPGTRLRLPLRVRAPGPPRGTRRRGTAPAAVPALAGPTRGLRSPPRALRP